MQMNSSTTKAHSQDVVIDESNQKPPLVASVKELQTLLDIIEQNIVPKTRKGVENGNKVFGAALLNPNFELILAETNNEMQNPLFHGEVNLINEWSKMTDASKRGPMAQESIFLSTHEPCCMCISSIVWAGFTKVFYLFPYSITSDQGIPHDIRTMHELWGVSTYRKQNRYISTACLMDLIDQLPESREKSELIETQKRLCDVYDSLSHQYHEEKLSNAENSLVLG